jgi:hypothetical protein
MSIGQRPGSVRDEVKEKEMAAAITGEPTNAQAPNPPICPRCLGLIPSNENPGAYPGAWSRRYRKQELGRSINDSTQVCSACGDEEAMLEAALMMSEHGQTTGHKLVDERWPVDTGRAPARRMAAHGKGVSHRIGKAIHQDGVLEVKETKRWPHPPHPRDVAEWRNDLMHAWAPGGILAEITPALATSTGQHFDPQWEFHSLKDASLWFVGKDMCDLLDGAAPQLPNTPLTDDICPFPEGLVVFEKPLFGIDAQGSDHEVAVGAYLWGRSLWSGDYSRMIGITVYGPNPSAHQRHLVLPLGQLIWPYGHGPDDGLDWMVDRDSRPANLTPAQKASMAEDRRRLMALWLLSSQPGIAQHRDYIDRATAKRELRAAEKARRRPLDSRVRIITLRRPPQPSSDAAGNHVDWQHHWMVSGHWRKQPYGPDRSLRRPKYINPYVKGDPDKPFLGGATVRSWTR